MKSTYLLVAILVLAGVGYYYFKQSPDYGPDGKKPAPSPDAEGAAS